MTSIGIIPVPVAVNPLVAVATISPDTIIGRSMG